jgi:hypothetical protein
MTTLVALSTKDSLVMGCDSLASVTKPLVDPWDLRDFFDDDFKIKTDAKGKPILNNFRQLVGKMEEVPYDHMTHVNKLCSLDPLPMAVMATGITSIGDSTVRSIVSEFKESDGGFKDPDRLTNFTVKSVAERMLKFIRPRYDTEYPKEGYRPYLELILGGYNKQSQIPSIYRIMVHDDQLRTTIADFGAVFGGEMCEIQRLVFGTDSGNRSKLRKRIEELLARYHQILTEYIKSNNAKVELPKPEQYTDQLDLFSDEWDLDGFTARVEDFSEQNAIECVDFFIDVMIKSQQFSARLPVVGGEKHIAIITKRDGCRFVSEEQFRHGEHTIPIEEKDSRK